MASPDFYRTLGVRHDAAPDEIRMAYHELAKTCHPDLHPDDPAAAQRFCAITEAYGVLIDPKRRATYDWFVAHGAGVSRMLKPNMAERIAMARAARQKAKQLFRAEATRLLENVIDAYRRILETVAPNFDPPIYRI